MDITLTPDIEKALTKHALQRGTSPEVLALRALRERFVLLVAEQTATDKQGSLFDYLADHLGVLSSGEHVAGGARMSENCGEKFGAGLLKKRREGRL